MSWLRDVDRWFIETVLPAGGRYRALAVRLVGEREAEDLVQEAYAKLLSLGEWRTIEHPPAFTLRIVRNLALYRLRRESLVRIEQVAAVERIEVADGAPGPHAIVSARQELDGLIALIETLPPRCREVIRMRKFEGMSPQAIADSLGLSVSTVEKHITKGVAILTRGLAARLEMADEGDRPNSWTQHTRRA